ncbi:MAG: sigma-70 family RNA polymerase sigma factor [Planctomycetes bacterium]|nr:sigma-70 family RNA polymerase sigma factor [Planctomycetota bacterium]
MKPHDEREPPEQSSSEIVEALVARHREFLAFLERRVGDRAIAEDILQDAFVRGLQKASAVRDDEAAVSWFYRLLRNAVVDHRRRASSAARGLETLSDELDRSPAHGGELAAVVCKCVADLAATLKPEYAQALRRIEVEGAAVKDFAAEVGISDSNAAVRIFRAREALREQVTRVCRTCAEHGCLDCSCSRSEGGSPSH